MLPQFKGGRFQIKWHLVAGGLGDVLLAWDTELERHVAIKFLCAEVDDEAALARFRSRGSCC